MSNSSREYRPTIAQLRAFVTIAEYRHFSTSAARLGISQPSLSQALVALEQGLGLQLIERSTRKVIVTAVGEALLPYARTAIETADDFVTHAKGVSESPSGALTIGMIPTIAPYILPSFLRLLGNDLPTLAPNIVEDQTDRLMEQLRQGTLDIAVIALPINENGIIASPLYEEDFFLAVPADHPLGTKTKVNPGDISDLNLLLLADGHCLRDQVLDICHNAGAKNKANQALSQAASLTTVVQCVAGGLGSTLIPESAKVVEGGREGVTVIPFNQSKVKTRRQVGIAYRASATPSRGNHYARIGELVTQSYQMTVDPQAKAAIIESILSTDANSEEEADNQE